MLNTAAAPLKTLGGIENLIAYDLLLGKKYAAQTHAGSLPNHSAFFPETPLKATKVFNKILQIADNMIDYKR